MGCSLTCLIANDHKKRVRYFHLGWPGSVHDERLMANCALQKDPSKFFHPGQHLPGDSTFSNKPWLVPAFNKTTDNGLNQIQEAFNCKLPKARVTSEHTIGILKCRWPMLRRIRMPLTEDVSTMNTIILHARALVTIHKLLIGWDDVQQVPDDNTDAVSSVRLCQIRSNTPNKEHMKEICQRW